MVPVVHVFTVLAAVRSEENIESGLCVSTSGGSSSAAWWREHLVSWGPCMLYLCTFVIVSYLSVVHDQNTVWVHHSVDAVSYGEHGAVVESLLDGVLDQSICLCVDGGGGFIQKNDLSDKGRRMNADETWWCWGSSRQFWWRKTEQFSLFLILLSRIQLTGGTLLLKARRVKEEKKRHKHI